MKTEDQVRKEMRNTPAGRLLVRYGFEPYETESSARRVAERAASDIADLLSALENVLAALPYYENKHRANIMEARAVLAKAKGEPTP